MNTKIFFANMNMKNCTFILFDSGLVIDTKKYKYFYNNFLVTSIQTDNQSDYDFWYVDRNNMRNLVRVHKSILPNFYRAHMTSEPLGDKVETSESKDSCNRCPVDGESQKNKPEESKQWEKDLKVLNQCKDLKLFCKPFDSLNLERTFVETANMCLKAAKLFKMDELCMEVKHNSSKIWSRTFPSSEFAEQDSVAAPGVQSNIIAKTARKLRKWEIDLQTFDRCENVYLHCDKFKNFTVNEPFLEQARLWLHAAKIFEFDELCIKIFSDNGRMLWSRTMQLH